MKRATAEFITWLGSQFRAVKRGDMSARAGLMDWALPQVTETVTGKRHGLPSLPDDAATALAARLCTDLEEWGDAGFPLVTLSIDTASALSETEPPEQRTWEDIGLPLLALEVGVFLVLVVPGWSGDFETDPLARHVFLRRRLEDGPFPIPTELRSALLLVENVQYALATRPEGLTVTEHRPSAKAARKQGRRYYPNVEYIIQPDRPLHRGRVVGVGSEPVEGWTLSVRCQTRGHWRNQPHGPGRQLRRPQWIAPFWRGPEDAPVSVHATRI